MYKTTKDSIYIEVVTAIVKTGNSVTYLDSNGRKKLDARKYFHNTKQAAKDQIIDNFESLVLEYETKLSYLQSQLDDANAIII